MALAMKLVVLLCAAVAVFGQPIELEESILESIEFYAGRDQSTILGNCQPTDKLLYAENVDVKSGILQVKKKDITYPANLAGQGGVITCIKVVDQLKTGKNAEVKIGSGGINQRLVIINLKSGKGDPIKYLVQIYGYN